MAVLLIVAMGAAQSWIGAQPAAAATPWLTVSDGFARFDVPAADIQTTMGDVSGVVVEANFGPSFAVAELGLGRSGNAWTSVIGPLPPGLYHYRLRGDDTKIVKDPTNPATVTSDPSWSTFFVPGDSARLLADVPEDRGGTVGKLTYNSGVAGAERTAGLFSSTGFDPAAIIAGVTPGPHGWDAWQKNLIDFAPRLFRDNGS